MSMRGVFMGALSEFMNEMLVEHAPICIPFIMARYARFVLSRVLFEIPTNEPLFWAAIITCGGNLQTCFVTPPFGVFVSALNGSFNKFNRLQAADDSYTIPFNRTRTGICGAVKYR
jgi:hypothetical protein